MPHNVKDWLVFYLVAVVLSLVALTTLTEFFGGIGALTKYTSATSLAIGGIAALSYYVYDLLTKKGLRF